MIPCDTIVMRRRRSVPILAISGFSLKGGSDYNMMRALVVLDVFFSNRTCCADACVFQSFTMYDDDNNAEGRTSETILAMTST